MNSTAEATRGSRGHEDLLTRKEAADWLSMPLHTIRKLVERQILEPAHVENQVMWFRQEDVVNVARSLQRGVTLTSASHHALQALAIAQRTERMLSDVMETLGSRYTPLSTEPEDVEELYERAEGMFRGSTEEMTAEQVRGWARIFFALNRGYLLLIENLTGAKEPWRVLLDAATKMMDEAPRRFFEQKPDLALAYSLLDSARQSFRQESYFYCRSRYSTKAAEMTFPETNGRDVNELILSML